MSMLLIPMYVPGDEISQDKALTYSNWTWAFMKYTKCNVYMMDLQKKGRFSHKYLIYIIPLLFPVKANMLSDGGVHKASACLIMDGYVAYIPTICYSPNMQRRCAAPADDLITIRRIIISKTTPTSGFLVIQGTGLSFPKYNAHISLDILTLPSIE